MSDNTKSVRAIVPLLKAPIVEFSDTHIVIAIGAQYGAPTTLRLSCDTRVLDIRKGDLQTIYTEFVIKPAQGSS